MCYEPTSLCDSIITKWERPLRMRDVDEHARNLAEAVDMALFDLEPEQVEA